MQPREREETHHQAQSHREQTTSRQQHPIHRAKQVNDIIKTAKRLKEINDTMKDINEISLQGDFDYFHSCLKVEINVTSSSPKYNKHSHEDYFQRHFTFSLPLELQC